MIKTAILCVLSFLAFTFATAQIKKTNTVNLIFDSDMGPDYDDAGAITILHAYADSGYVKILATMTSTNYEGVAGVMSVFNTYFKRPNIPVGVPKGEAVSLHDAQHWTDSLLKNYPHSIKTNSQAHDAVKLYRKILASRPDQSITIVTVGFLTNLSNLMSSGPDQYSPLTGMALIKKKVKLLVSMAGKYPDGYEFNIMKDVPAAQNVFNNWSTPVIFSGFEIGMKIMAGIPLIHNAAIKHDPVKDVFGISIPQAAEDSLGRKSWDETAVLVAIKGAAPYYTLKSGKIKIGDNGQNFWDDKASGQAYLVEKESPAAVQKLINKLIMHQPVKKGR